MLWTLTKKSVLMDAVLIEGISQASEISVKKGNGVQIYEN